MRKVSFSRSRGIVLLLFFLSFFSCEKDKEGKAGLPQFSFFSGECLRSEEMQLKQSYNLCSPPEYEIRLFLDREEVYAKTFGKRIGWLPSDKCWSSFGPDEKAVREEFFNHRAADVIYNGIQYGNEPIMIQNGVIQLFADKEFAGYPAGTNLFSNCFQIRPYSVPSTRIRDVGILDEDMIPDDIPMDELAFSLPTLVFVNKDGFTATRDDKTMMTLIIPVKVGFYLSCLRDRLTDPYAQMVFEERTLHCTFPSDVMLTK